MGVSRNSAPLSKNSAVHHQHGSDPCLRDVAALAPSHLQDRDFDSDENDISESSSSLLSSSTSSTTPSGPQRAISFSPIVEFYDIIRLEDFTEKEIRRSWYTPEEKEKIVRHKDRLVARMEAGKPPKGDMTYQGLYCWTTAGGQALDDSIALVVNSVMDEQDRQWAANQDDSVRIAQISAAVTAHSARAALETGLKDEMEARIAWNTHDALLTSNGSNEVEDNAEAPPSACPQLFAAPKGLTRKGSKVQPPENCEDLHLITSSKSDMSTRSVERATRASLDPPAPVKRTYSQDGSEVLFRMRTVSHKMSAQKH